MSAGEDDVPAAADEVQAGVHAVPQGAQEVPAAHGHHQDPRRADGLQTGTHAVPDAEDPVPVQADAMPADVYPVPHGREVRHDGDDALDVTLTLTRTAPPDWTGYQRRVDRGRYDGV